MSSNQVDLKVDWCSYQAAKYAVEKWHYSESLPYAGKMVKLGCWENKDFIGVVLFSWGANNNAGKPYGLELGEWCELVRIALREHEMPVSSILSKSISKLKSQSPNLRLIISYSDLAQNHVGIIYQASNWIYDGKTKGTRFYKVNNKWVHQRMASSILGSIRGLPSKYSADKHRYLYPLDKAMRRQIEPLAKPYPKRDE